MVLTRETPRTRWLVLLATWVVVALTLTWDTVAMRDYVGLLASAGTSPDDATPLRRPCPGSFSDSHTWVRLALASQEGGPWQVRSTDIDNAPKGRDVHWNSYFVHLVSLAGRLQHALTGAPLPRATENALAWFNLPLLLACVIGFSSWAAARAGAGAGVLVAFGMIGHRSFYDGFMPNYVDHHGLLTACAFGLMLGGVFMGAGWWRAGEERPRLLPVSQAAARRAAVVSGVSGAVGMWISVFSTIPVIAMIGITGLGSLFWLGRRAQAEGAKFDPGIWRLWGRVGGTACLVFYLLEYAPGNLGLRLEVNHPLFGLAWWGASEVIASIGTWRLGGPAARPRVHQWIMPILGIAVAPVMVLTMGEAVFVLRDPFVMDLRHTVGEGMSFRAAARAFGSAYTQRYFINFALVGVAVLLLWFTRRDRITFAFATLLLAAFVTLACIEIRWWMATSAAFLCAWLVIAAAFTANRGKVATWLVPIAMGAALLPFGALGSAQTIRKHVQARTVDDADMLEPLYRDIAAALRSAAAGREIILLGSPDASTGIGYYGRIKTLGTLFWENTAGLKAAAGIYCAQSDDEARELMRARGITHVAMISKANYVDEYFRLLRPDLPPSDVEKTFGHRLFIRQQVPRWLRALPFRLPPNIAMPGLNVLLLAVTAEQNEHEASWTLAQAQIAGGNLARAEPTFRRAIAAAAPEKRAALFKEAADAMYQYRAHGPAIRLYREGLALQPETWLASNLAWVLATAPDAALRNGREALALVEPLWRAQPNDVGLLNTFAAALAETGRFADAVTVASRAVELFRSAGNPTALAILQQRVESYRAGRAWRD